MLHCEQYCPSSCYIVIICCLLAWRCCLYCVLPDFPYVFRHFVICISAFGVKLPVDTAWLSFTYCNNDASHFRLYSSLDGRRHQSNRSSVNTDATLPHNHQPTVGLALGRTNRERYNDNLFTWFHIPRFCIHYRYQHGATLSRCVETSISPTPSLFSHIFCGWLAVTSDMTRAD